MCEQMDRQKDLTILTDAFCDYAKAPYIGCRSKTWRHYCAAKNNTYTGIILERVQQIELTL